MGVPSFVRWLVNKYPKVVAKAIHHRNKLDEEPPDTGLPNPNCMEFDNLYLDMNGIIHPCFHPESDEDAVIPPTTFEEVFINIFEYIDRLFDIVRPRQLLYLAIDGVAPRAKMNQQRTRRFKSAKDKELAEEEEEMLRRRFKLEGKQVLPKQDQSQVSDSNIITPGTDFMYKLSNALRGYINSRLSNDSCWKNIKVILSDANVAGEGEHKIMSFIRQQRKLPSYNPNTRHCLYGLDADLIMLALATHEVHFSILREDFLNQEKPRTNRETIGETSSSLMKSDDKKSSMIANPYQFVHVWILREYLELDMEIKDPPKDFKFDLERLVDDFIFICFFAGNDFLPHMPTLDIHEGAIDLLMAVYKNEFKNLGGYLVDMPRVNDKKWGFIKLSRVEKFILSVGSYEEKIFKKRSELHERKLKRLCRHHDNSLEEETDAGNSTLDSSNTACAFFAGEETEVSIGTFDNNLHSRIIENTKELKQKLKDNIRRKSDLFKNGDLGTDKVRLAAPGYKERYYKHKFSAEGPGDIESQRKAVVKYYTEGLLWVLMYYFSGPPSWTWFYPFHYGPFASDLKGIAQVKPKFQKGCPFKPIDTLMAVLPPRSAHALPIDYQKLMIDESSKISDFYPSDFEIDMDGKRFTWQGICKLPFIEENRLLIETKKLEKELTGEERDRNTEKYDQLFLRRTHTLASRIVSLLSAHKDESIKIDTCSSFEIGGFVCLLDAAMGEDVKLEEDNVLCVMYKLLDSGPHLPRLLDGVEHPIKTITKDELMETKLWHEYQGSTPTYTPTSTNKVQGGFPKPDKMVNGGFKSNVTGASSSPELGHKFAGSGWGYGRGKPVSTPDNFGNYCNTPMGKHDNYKPLQGFKGLKISGSSNGRSRPNGRAQSVNNDFWAARNCFGHDTNNYAWQHHSSQSIHPSQGRGRGQHDYISPHYSPFAANQSSPASGRGRAHFVQRGSINEGNRWW